MKTVLSERRAFTQKAEGSRRSAIGTRQVSRKTAAAVALVHRVCRPLRTVTHPRTRTCVSILHTY